MKIFRHSFTRLRQRLNWQNKPRCVRSELMKVNGISQLDYDQSVLQVHSIKADIEVLKVQIRKTEVHAPFDGVIGLRNISLGAEVTPSTSLATIRAVKQLKLDFSVPEKYSTQVKPGQRFNLQFREMTRNMMQQFMQPKKVSIRAPVI